MAETVRVEVPIEVIDETNPELSNIANNFKQADSAAKSAQQSIASASQYVSKFDRSMAKTKQSLSNWVKQKYQLILEAKDNVGPLVSKAKSSVAGWAKGKYQALLEAKDKFSPILEKLKSGAKSIAGKAWSITVKAVDLATAPLRGIINVLKNPIFQVGAILGVSVGLKDTVDTFATFEATMSKVKALSGATGTEFEQLTQKAKDLGATTKFTATESAEAMNYMAMAGWSASDMAAGIGGVLNLAAASGEDLATTSDIVTDALTAFRMKAAESGRFADVLAVAASKANTTVSGMGETFKYVGAMAGSLGYSIEDVALATGIMANSGIKGTMAGTSLNSIMTRLATNTSGARDAIEKLGVSFYDGQGNARDFSDVLVELRSATANMTDEQKSSFANTVAGLEAQKGLLALLNASESDWNSFSEAVNNADGAAASMSDTMMDNLQGAFTLLQSAADGVKISLGERLKPYLLDLTNWLTDQMPNIEAGLMSFMDFIDEKVDSFKGKISEMTASDEWQNADPFGKMKIAWDELIVEPFSDWWKSNGKEKLAGIAQDIGTGLGTGISTGILTLLGLDISSTIDEGANVGRQFAEGFAEGFKGIDIISTLGKAMSGLFSNVGKFIPGGESADFSSFLSAALLGKMLNVGIGGVKFGKSIFTNAKKIIGSFSVADELAGIGNANGSGLLGLFGNTGMRLGAGTTSAGIALAGGASIAGGIAGGISIVSGLKDIYTGRKASDEDEREANYRSSFMKLSGVATGAFAGATIGSAIPVVGTAAGALIGAGIGGIAGMIGGNKVKKEYEESKTAAEEAAAAAELMEEKSKYALEGSRFDSNKLASAFEDTTVSASEFASMMQKAVNDKVKDSFGDIKLSAEEISDAAKKITFEGLDAGQMSKFATATEQAKSSLSNFQSAVSSMDKLNWKAGIGLISDSESIAEYKSGIDSLIESAKSYIEDKQYEATAAITLLVGEENSGQFTESINAMYANIQSQLDSAGNELTAQLDIALEDGVIDADEQQILSELQQKITDITNQLNDAEVEASLQTIKIKYSGAQLDAESFASLTAELQEQVTEAASKYEDALKVSLTNLNLELSSGAINQQQFDEQLAALTEGYQANITQLAVNVESFQLQSIQDAFGSELDGILPDLEGTVSERLGTALNNALSAGVDVQNWDVATAAEWLDLDGLSGETQATIASMMSEVASSIPEQLTSAMSGADLGIGDKIGEAINSSMENVDLTETASAISNQLGDSLSNIDMSESGSGLQEGLQSSLSSSIENIDLSEAATGLSAKLGESMANIDVADSGSGLQEGLQNSIMASIEGIDLSGAASSLNAQLGAALSEIDISESGAGLSEGIQSSFASALESVDLSGAISTLSNSIGAEIANIGSGIDYSGVTSSVGSGVSSAILATLSQIQGAINTLRSQVGAAINSAFASGFQTTTTVTITVNYKLANPTATISFSGGGTGTATVSASIGSHAEGGFVNGPEFSLIGEDGPEAIIPLGGKRRQRGFDLWKRAGEMLGVSMHADGGIFSKNTSQIAYNSVNNEAYHLLAQIASDNPTAAPLVRDMLSDDESEGNAPVSILSNAESESDRPAEIKLDITVNPVFQVNSASGNESDIIKIIRAHMNELMDEIGEGIADRLEMVFSNMPVKGT